jgi:hypothetical protein
MIGFVSLSDGPHPLPAGGSSLPVALPDLAVTTPGTPVTLHPAANDAGAPPLAVVGFGAAAYGEVVLNADQTLTYTPAAGFIGSDSFTYTLADASGEAVTGSVSVIVNDLPVANDDQARTAAGLPVEIAVLDNDRDAGPLSLAALGTPGHGDAELLAGQRIRYLPQPGFAGSDSFTYTVVDAHGATATATVSVTVDAANRPPVAVDDAATTQLDTPLVLDLLANDNDPDGDPLTLAGLGIPAHGSLAVAPDQTVTYTPEPGFTGEDMFAYTVTDGRGRQAGAEARIAVERPNTAPVAGAIAATTQADTPLRLDLLAQAGDADGDAVELTTLTLPAHGQLTVHADRSVTYTPAPGFAGEDGFIYTVGDGRGGSAAAVVRIAVEPPPVPPTYANGYAARRRIVVPPRPAGGEPAADLVALISETGSWLRSQAHGGQITSESGHDLRFELEDGTKLAHELELYDGSAGRLLAWVRIPGWDPATALRLFLYLGKPGIATSEAEPAAVWSGYLAVWDARTGIDRSGHGRHLTPGALQAGELIGPAARFPGDATASIADAAWCTGHAALTLQCWAKADAAALGSNRGLLAQGQRGNGDQPMGLLLRYASTGFRGGASNPIVWSVRTSAGVARLESAADVHGTAARALHAVWRSGELPQLYLDGVTTAASWAGAIVDNVATSGQPLTGTTMMATGELTLGAGSAAGEAGSWLGLIDEVRLRATAPTAGWVAIEHASQADPQGFYGLGADEAPAEPAGSVVAVPRRVTTAAGSWVDTDVLASAYLPAGAPAPTIAAVSQPAHGLATIVAGKVRYTPNAGFIGHDSLTYTLASGGKQSTARLTVEVSPLQAEYPPPLRTVTVSSDSALRTAVAAARPGDHIVLQNGVYSGSALSIVANGTAAAPVVVKAANKLGSEVRFRIDLNGDHLILWGLRFTGDTGKVVLSGHYDRVLRCEFTGWRPGHAVRFVGGSHGEVRYCHIHDPGPWTQQEIDGRNGMRINLRFTGSAASFHKFGRVSRCLFKNTLQRPVPGDYNTGQADFIEVGENVADYPGVSAEAVIEHCLFDGNLDPKASGIVDIKISGVTVQGCTFKNAPIGRLDNRGGGNSRYLSNYFKASTSGMAIYGGKHLIAGNVLETGPKLQIGVGTEEWNQYLQGEYQRPKDVLCVSNTGLLIVGSKAPGDPNATLAAEGTRIEDHVGTIRTQQNYAGSWDTPTGGLVEQGTTWAAAASLSVARAVELSEADVGPDAPWAV